MPLVEIPTVLQEGLNDLTTQRVLGTVMGNTSPNHNSNS